MNVYDWIGRLWKILGRNATQQIRIISWMKHTHIAESKDFVNDGFEI